MRKSNHFRDLTDMNEPSHYNHHITPPRQNQRLSDQIALLSDERIFLPVKWKNVLIAYTTLKAEQGGLINAQIMNADNSIYMCIYSSLTYDGHQFLDNVRSNSIWSRTKSIAKKLGCTSLNSLMSIAGKIALDVIQSQL